MAKDKTQNTKHSSPLSQPRSTPPNQKSLHFANRSATSPHADREPKKCELISLTEWPFPVGPAFEPIHSSELTTANRIDCQAPPSRCRSFRTPDDTEQPGTQTAGWHPEEQSKARSNKALHKNLHAYHSPNGPTSGRPFGAVPAIRITPIRAKPAHPTLRDEKTCS